MGSKKRTRARESGFFAWLLPRPFRRALETLFGGRRRGEMSGTVGDTEFFKAHGSMGEVWDEEMSSSMLGTRLRKVVQNYQVMSCYHVMLTTWPRPNGLIVPCTVDLTLDTI